MMISPRRFGDTLHNQSDKRVADVDVLMQDDDTKSMMMMMMIER